MIMGNFNLIKNFKSRTQAAVREIMQEDTKKSRERLCKMATEALAKVIHLPEKSRDTIYEEFDPVLILNEALQANLEPILSKLLDYDGDDAGYIALIRAESQQVIGAYIEDVEEGFIDGLNDVLPFIKENVSAIIKSSADA